MSINPKNSLLSRRIIRLFGKQPSTYHTKGILSFVLLLTLSTAFAFVAPIQELPSTESHEVQEIAIINSQEIPEPLVVPQPEEMPVMDNVPVEKPVAPNKPLEVSALPDTPVEKPIVPETPVEADTVPKEDGKKKVQINVMSKSETQPVYIIDGEEVSHEEVGELNPDEIEKINVLKDKNATDKYGSKGSNGVVEITTKDNSTSTSLKGYGTKAEKRNDNTMSQSETQPLYIIDGEKVPYEKVEELNADKIEQVDVLKDKNATEKHGADGKNGVVEITTKVNSSLKGQANKKSTESNNDHSGLISFSGHGTDGGQPLIIINGEVKGRKHLEDVTVAAKDIYDFKLLTGETARKEYGEEGKDGVIIITTKDKDQKE